MDQPEYDRVASLRPSIFNHITFWVFLILYMCSFVFVMIKAWELEPNLVHMLHDKPNDMVFALYGNGVFSICVLFLYIPTGFVFLSLPFRILPGFTDTYKWYDLRSSKTGDYNSFRRVTRRNRFIALVASGIALFFLVLSAGLHLRISESGIFYQRFFSTTEERIDWSRLNAVQVFPELAHSRKSGKNLSPKMNLVFSGDEVEIWQGAGLGSPSADELIRFIGMVQRFSGTRISVNSQLDSEMTDELYNHSDTWKRDNIVRTFDYLKQIVDE